jgi:flagellar assembly protein FliH
MMRNYTRFIPGEEIDAVAQWRFGDVDAASILLEERGRAKEEAVQAEIQRQQGYAEGFVQGRAQAMLEAQREINEFISNQGQEAAREFARLLEAAHAEFDAAEQATAQGVLELACELARQMLRHEISSNPNALLPVIREALSLLFADSRGVQVKLNPLDLDVLQDVLREEFPNLPLKLQGDPAVTRGGCVVESGGTVVDGRLEKRWARAIGQLGQKLPWEGPGDEQ